MNRIFYGYAVLSALLLAATPRPLYAEGVKTASGAGQILIPESSGIGPASESGRMSTHLRVFLPAQRYSPYVGPPELGYFVETPGSLACIYRLASLQPGCDPNTAFALASGGSRAIAIVDAYDSPTIVSDVQTFSRQFGLPAANFSVVFAGGSRPPQDSSGGWGIEAALDVEIAHALAPKAHIYLVEAASNAVTDLFAAEDLASSLVARAGGGEVSNSWGGAEFVGQASYDTHFATRGVVYFASVGDSPGVSWPATSANVIAAGGTTTSRNPATGQFTSEASWAESGGGLSTVTPRPSYQNAIGSIVGGHRGIPDLSFDANPHTGVWVYYSGSVSGQPGGWWVVGGTSVAAPALAAIVNAAGNFRVSSAAELAIVYNGLGIATEFFDEVRGICGPYGGYNSVAGWDYCTGLGSPRGYAGK